MADFLRRHRRRLFEELFPGETAAEAGPESTAILRELMQRFEAQSTPLELTLFELSFLNDLPATEIARRLGLLEAEVYQHRSRLAKRLRALQESIPGRKRQA